MLHKTNLHALATSLVFSTLIASPFAAAQTKEPILNLKSINKMTEACIKDARKSDLDIAIAIYNEHGVLLSYTQTEGATLATGEVARWKAKSAAIYRVTTAITAEWNVPTAPFIATVKGGVPIFTTDGIALGGIGVSGAAPDYDESCGVTASKAAGFVNEKSN